MQGCVSHSTQSAATYTGTLSQLKGSSRFLIAAINQLTAKKAFQNEFHNVAHAGDEEVATAKQGFHQLSKPSQQHRILLHISAEISSELPVNTMHVLWQYPTQNNSITLKALEPHSHGCVLPLNFLQIPK